MLVEVIQHAVNLICLVIILLGLIYLLDKSLRKMFQVVFSIKLLRAYRNVYLAAGRLFLPGSREHQERYNEDVERLEEAYNKANSVLKDL